MHDGPPVFGPRVSPPTAVRIQEEVGDRDDGSNINT